MAAAPEKASIVAAHETVLVVPEPARAGLCVRGADRASWLNGLLTCDVKKLAPGAAAYGLAVTQKGRVLADVVVLVAADAITLAVPETARAELLAHFERYLIMEDAEVTSTDEAFFSAHGPKAAALATAVSAPSWPLDVLGTGGVVFAAPASSAAELAGALAVAAEGLGGLVGDAAGWEAVRLERGVPAFGADFDATTYPQEASLERRAVAFDKGCYLGQEVVCMLEMRGHVKRKLVPLDVAGATSAGAVVTDAAGTDLGKVTSAWVAPDGAHARVLAMVKLAHASAGTELRVDGHTARVVG
jgi:folate-binding protein YgfZ